MFMLMDNDQADKINEYNGDLLFRPWSNIAPCSGQAWNDISDVGSQGLCYLFISKLSILVHTQFLNRTAMSSQIKNVVKKIITTNASFTWTQFHSAAQRLILCLLCNFHFIALLTVSTCPEKPCANLLTFYCMKVYNIN